MTSKKFVYFSMEISFVVAIDFTSSNGDPSDPGSLHTIDPNQRNQYELAIESVGHVLQYYDTDKLFPAYGFGARVGTLSRISHKFPINFNGENPSCEGVIGILKAYKDCLRKVRLDGPTNLAPVIRYVSEQAGLVKDASNYFILLIITDGIYSDKTATLQAIVEAAKLPMSIIIVGVGNEDFTEMIKLDGDEERISFRGEAAERDIVQFVALREHLGQDSEVKSQKRLNASLLEEIPDQVTQYMKQRNLEPKPSPPEYSVR